MRKSYLILAILLIVVVSIVIAETLTNMPQEKTTGKLKKEKEVIVNENRVIEKVGKGKIKFENSFNVEIEDVEDNPNVYISDNLIAINTEELPELNQPATITFYNVSFEPLELFETPIIFYSEKFTTNPAEVFIPCLENICYNINYDKEIGTLTFDVAHFSTFALLPLLTKFKVGADGNMEQLPEGIILLYPDRYGWYSAMTLDTRRNAKGTKTNCNQYLAGCDIYGGVGNNMCEFFDSLALNSVGECSSVAAGVSRSRCYERRFYGGHWTTYANVWDNARVIFDTANIPSTADVYFKFLIDMLAVNDYDWEREGYIAEPFSVVVSPPGSVLGISAELDGTYESLEVDDYVTSGETTFHIDYDYACDDPPLGENRVQAVSFNDPHLLLMYQEGVGVNVNENYIEPKKFNKIAVRAKIPDGSTIELTLQATDMEDETKTLGPYSFTETYECIPSYGYDLSCLWRYLFSDEVYIGCVTAKEIEYEIKLTQNENGDAPILYDVYYGFGTPTINVTMSPENPGVCDDLTCRIEIKDKGADSFEIEYNVTGGHGDMANTHQDLTGITNCKWEDDVCVAELTIPNEYTNYGDNINCNVKIKSCEAEITAGASIGIVSRCGKN